MVRIVSFTVRLAVLIYCVRRTLVTVRRDVDMDITIMKMNAWNALIIVKGALTVIYVPNVPQVTMVQSVSIPVTQAALINYVTNSMETVWKAVLKDTMVTEIAAKDALTGVRSVRHKASVQVAELAIGVHNVNTSAQLDVLLALFKEYAQMVMYNSFLIQSLFITA